MKLYIASNNDNKIKELESVFKGCNIVSPLSAGINFDFEETENSFIANSIAKAKALWTILGQAVLADDSGLCVDALNGRPGVLSARYGSVDGKTTLTAKERNALLLKEMQGKTNRSCSFVCAMTLFLNPNRVFVVQENCEGLLLEEPRGYGGFGYDPIVYLPELSKTMAELTTEEKNLVSHRGRAAAKMAEIIKVL